MRKNEEQWYNVISFKIGPWFISENSWFNRITHCSSLHRQPRSGRGRCRRSTPRRSPGSGALLRSLLHDSCRWKWLKNDSGNPTAGAVRVCPHTSQHNYSTSGSWFISYISTFKTCLKTLSKERLLNILHTKGNYYTPSLSLQRWKSWDLHGSIRGRKK